MAVASRAHDCLVNVHFGDSEQPEYMFRVKNEYFKKDDSIFGKWDMPKVLDEMDANGVERAVLTANMKQLGGSPVKFAEARPDRFALTAGGFDFLRSMPAEPHPPGPGLRPLPRAAAVLRFGIPA